MALTGKTSPCLKAGTIAVLVLAFAGATAAQPRTDQHHTEQALAADQTTETPAAADGYQACVGTAAAAHDASQAAECKRIGDKERTDYDNCVGKLNLPKSYCDASYIVHEVSSACTLPPAAASVLDASLEQARNRCRKDSNAAVQ